MHSADMAGTRTNDGKTPYLSESPVAENPSNQNKAPLRKVAAVPGKGKDVHKKSP